MRRSPNEPDRLRVSANRLRVSATGLRERGGAIVELGGVPLPPEHLVELAGSIPAAVGSVLVLRFADYFPWSFDERLRSPGCYPDEVVTGLVRAARRAGAVVVPGVDLLTGLQEICHIASYDRLTGFSRDRRAFTAAAPGARALAGEILQDVLSLLTDVELVYVGGDHPGRIGAGVTRFVAEFLLPVTLLAAQAGARPVLRSECLAGANEEELRRLAETGKAVVIFPGDENAESDPGAGRVLEAGCEAWLSIAAFREESGSVVPRPPALCDAESAIVSNAFAAGFSRVVFDLRTTNGFFQAGAILLEEYAAMFPGCGDERSQRLARRLQDFRESLAECWVWLRRTKETLVLATHDPRRRTADGDGLRRLIDLARLNGITKFAINVERD